jgi:hypothetical protein
MTLWEFYRNQFEEAKSNKWFNEDGNYLAEIYGAGTFKRFKAMSKRYFGGGFAYRYKKAGITAEQLRQAREQGFIKYIYDTSWQARQLNQQEWYGLTVKGLKALYKAYPEWN